MSDIDTATVVSIRDCGLNEYWLQERIFADPSILGLGDLQAVARERTQPQGGRLDILLKNPEDDSMFEVELQLGATNESHIIRTIEYWDAEKRRWPSRSHKAVLVAEEITNRFFNVVHLLGMAVPIIGIQVNVVQIGESRALHFTKIVDSYEEPEDDDPPPGGAFDEAHAADNYPGALECARWYKTLLEKLYGEVQVKYFESYVSLSVGGTARVWIYGRKKKDRAYVQLRHGEDGFQEAVDRLNAEGVSFTARSNGKDLAFSVNVQQLQEWVAIHEWLASRLSPDALLRRQCGVGGEDGGRDE
ncbi:MAG: hypothetical protein JXO22_00525 [Phycisphaerae bacterium]|nr:hypothetical protein [Phycisphaerae bacterium]